MSRLKLGGDLPALNPEFAAQQAKSKAKTPSGRGNGFTDDAQAYTDPPTQDRRAILTRIMRDTLGMLDVWGGEWEGTAEARGVRRAIGKYLRRLGEA